MRRDPFVYLVLLFLTLVAFWQVSRCDFINYDDPLDVQKNPHIQSGLTAGNIWWAFTTSEFSNCTLSPAFPTCW